MQQLKDKEREDLFKSLSSGKEHCINFKKYFFHIFNCIVSIAESSTDALIEELMKNNFGNSDPQRVIVNIFRY